MYRIEVLHPAYGWCDPSAPAFSTATEAILFGLRIYSALTWRWKQTERYNGNV